MKYTQVLRFNKRNAPEKIKQLLKEYKDLDCEVYDFIDHLLEIEEQ